jgi:hypothetical protein
MKKTTDDLKQKIRGLKLKLIEVQTQIERASSKAVEDFKVLMGYVAPGYKTTVDLKTEEKTIKNQIAFLEAEAQTAKRTRKMGSRPEGRSTKKLRPRLRWSEKRKKSRKARESTKFWSW